MTLFYLKSTDLKIKDQTHLDMDHCVPPSDDLTSSPRKTLASVIHALCIQERLKQFGIDLSFSTLDIFEPLNKDSARRSDVFKNEFLHVWGPIKWLGTLKNSVTLIWPRRAKLFKRPPKPLKMSKVEFNTSRARSMALTPNVAGTQKNSRKFGITPILPE